MPVAPPGGVAPDALDVGDEERDPQKRGRGNGAGSSDEAQGRDKEVQQLLEELRIVLPGVEILFGFLLTVPFNQGFDQLPSYDQIIFFVGLLAAAAASVALIAPSAFHRIRWRDRGDVQERMLRTANWQALLGLAGLAVAMTCGIFVVADLLFGLTVAAVATTSILAFAFVLWIVVPLRGGTASRSGPAARD